MAVPVAKQPECCIQPDWLSAELAGGEGSLGEVPAISTGGVVRQWLCAEDGGQASSLAVPAPSAGNILSLSAPGPAGLVR